MILKSHKDDSPTLEEVARAIRAMRHDDLKTLSEQIEIQRSCGERSVSKITADTVFDAAAFILESAADNAPTDVAKAA